MFDPQPDTDQPGAEHLGAAPEKPLAPGLYLVATPIGNLEDITLRALRVLRSVDRIACEDTRQTAKLLSHFGIRTPTVSYHAHNEVSRASELVEELKTGGRIAVVSDAGVPGVADPGAALVAEAIVAGVVVFPVPGANAALSALIASGLDAEHFTFHGFLPAKEGQRRSALEALRAAIQRASELPGGGEESPTTHIFYEAPHRILATLADLAQVFGPAQKIVLARELTKLHEEFLRGAVSDVLATLSARSSVRGEMVLLLDGGSAIALAAATTETPAPALGEEVAALIRRENLSENDALKHVARARGIGKSEVYREWQRAQARRRLGKTPDLGKTPEGL